jgi:hypothetical protein
MPAEPEVNGSSQTLPTGAAATGAGAVEAPASAPATQPSATAGQDQDKGKGAATPALKSPGEHFAAGREAKAAREQAASRATQPPAASAAVTAKEEPAGAEKPAPATIAVDAATTTPPPAAPPAPATTPSPTTTPAQPQGEIDWTKRGPELEREVSQFRQRTEQAQQHELSQKQNEELSAIASLMKGQEVSYDRLQARYAQAQQDGDTDLAGELYQQAVVLAASHRANQELLNSKAASFQEVQDRTYWRGVAANNTAIAKEFGLTWEDIKAANPKADHRNPYTVQIGLAKAVETRLATRHEAEIKKLTTELEAVKEKAKTEVEAARAKWDTKSPAAKVDRSAGPAGAAPERQWQPGDTPGDWFESARQRKAAGV